jgi:hypothetical protein
MRWQLLMASMLLTGCSLPSLDLASGGSSVAAEQIGAGMYRIPLRPPGWSNCGSADECTLLGAAEAAKGLGGTHFMVVPGHGSPSQSGFAYIKVFTLEPGEILPTSAVSVDEILYFLNRRPNSSEWATQVVSSTAQ